MVGGIGRYMQIARCFRDEDPRADRQPEFTQIDVEMSFVGEDDVIAMMEGCMRDVWCRALDDDDRRRFRSSRTPRRCERYGSDKPDLRFGLELSRRRPAFRGSDFQLFHIAGRGGRAIA